MYTRTSATHFGQEPWAYIKSEKITEFEDFILFAEDGEGIFSADSPRLRFNRGNWHHFLIFDKIVHEKKETNRTVLDMPMCQKVALEKCRNYFCLEIGLLIVSYLPEELSLEYSMELQNTIGIHKRNGSFTSFPGAHDDIFNPNFSKEFKPFHKMSLAWQQHIQAYTFRPYEDVKRSPEKSESRLSHGTSY